MCGEFSAQAAERRPRLRQQEWDREKGTGGELQSSSVWDSICSFMTVSLTQKRLQAKWEAKCGNTRQSGSGPDVSPCLELIPHRRVRRFCFDGHRRPGMQVVFLVLLR